MNANTLYKDTLLQGKIELGERSERYDNIPNTHVCTLYMYRGGYRILLRGGGGADDLHFFLS